MDPDTNLEEQLSLAQYILNDEGPVTHSDEALRLAELVNSLNHWIKGGGFLPTKWRPDGA